MIKTAYKLYNKIKETRHSQTPKKMVRPKIDKNKKTILLTGDDGFSSIGTRLLIHYLKDDYQLFVGGTNTQQSAMGGRLSLKGGKWGEKLIDGVPGIWVEGSPVDAVGAAYKHFGHRFDYVISGINLGANIGGANISSGTFSAVFRAMNVGITKKGIAISWDITPDFWLMEHNAKENLDRYIKHPGENAKKVISMALENNLWQADLLNINIPLKKAKKVSFTKPIANVEEFYTPIKLEQAPQTFHYPCEMMDIVNTIPGTDLHALQKGKISISPCRTDFMDMETFKKVKDIKLDIK
jgi:5'-nucleotidase